MRVNKDKVKVSFPYKSMILNAEDMSELIRILSKAEAFEEKYDNDIAKNILMICPYPSDQTLVNIYAITNNMYNMAKLANDKQE